MIHSYLVWFLWWLRHGAIGPIEATLFGVNVDWIDFRIYTFELAIRLSKVQQWALLLSTVFWRFSLLRLSFVNPVECISTVWSCAEHSETSYFAATFAVTLHHYMTQEPGRHATCRCGVFSFWFSGEVKHIVHLIRWNLKAVYANWGKTWPRSRQGNNARPLGFLGTESCLTILLFPFFSPTSPHWSLITLLLASP